MAAERLVSVDRTVEPRWLPLRPQLEHLDLPTHALASHTSVEVKDRRLGDRRVHAGVPRPAGVLHRRTVKVPEPGCRTCLRCEIRDTFILDSWPVDTGCHELIIVESEQVWYLAQLSTRICCHKSNQDRALPGWLATDY